MASRQFLTLFAGIVTAIFAGLLLTLAAFLAFTGTRMNEPIVLALISIFPLLIAIACLSPKRRTSALRLVGGITALATGGLLIASFVSSDVEMDRRGRGICVVTMLAAAAIAVKGRWPS